VGRYKSVWSWALQDCKTGDIHSNCLLDRRKYWETKERYGNEDCIGEWGKVAVARMSVTEAPAAEFLHADEHRGRYEKSSRRFPEFADAPIKTTLLTSP
jgi:hypothetical protein